MGYCCRTLLRDTLVRHCCGTLLWDSLPAPQILRVLHLYYKVASSQLPAPQIAPRTKVVLQSRQFSASSSTDCSAYLKLYYKVASSLTSSHLPAPQIPRVLKLYYKVASARLHFARSTRTISAEGCAGTGQIALSPAFRALDTHDLRRGLRTHGTNRALACISRARHARSPQRVARAWDKSHSGLHFAHSTRTISAEGCASSLQNERFVRDFLTNSHVKVCKTSVSYETSSKSQAETPIGAHTSRSPAKQFRDSSPSKQHPLTRQSQCDSDIHLYHNSQPHDSLRLPRIFPHPHV